MLYSTNFIVFHIKKDLLNCLNSMKNIINQMDKIDLNTPILLLHGLGGKPTLSFFGISSYLRYKIGFTKILIPGYPVDKYEDIEQCLKFIDNYLVENNLDREKDELIVIGQSMGGLYAHNLHRKKWKIKLSISIGSPVKGANLLHIAEYYLPSFIKDIFRKPPYEYLKKNIEQPIPPHPYHCITMGWFYGTNFDGVVFRDQSYLDDKNSTHYEFSDHRFFNYNPRLFFKLEELISNIN